MKNRLHSVLLALLACLMCAITASAYDFQVDGIYYNITSSNTVEVTRSDAVGEYHDFEYYNCEIDIPSQVTNDCIIYTVTAIGDSAYYGCNISSISIPRTIESIGIAAFKNCDLLLLVSCNSTIPPKLNDSFDATRSIYLLVYEEDYDDYKSEYDRYDFFNQILCKNVRIDSLPYCGAYWYNDGVVFVFNFDSVGSCKIYFQTTQFYTSSYSYRPPKMYNLITNNCTEIHEWSNLMPNEFHCDAFAVIDDKYFCSLPIYNYSNGVGGGYGYDEDEGVIVYESDATWNIMNNSVFYKFYTDNTYDYPLAEWLGVTYQGYESDFGGYVEKYYSGAVVIPSYVHFAIWDLPVKSVDPEAFYHCVDLISVTLPNTIERIGSDAFNTTNLKKLVLPTSIHEISYSAFDNCRSESVYITGDGEWQGGALPDSVKYLYIGSGVTGVKGMQVDPETIYCYATTPPVCDEQSFMGYDAELHVPAASLAAYFTAPYWCNFTNIVGDAVPVTELSLNQDNVEVLVGSQATLRASVTPANAAPATVEWQSSDTTIATVDNGVITALKAGECNITAICQDKMAVCHVNVTEIVPTGVTLDVEHAKIEVGSQLKLTATVQPDDATDKVVFWSSSNQSVATVDEHGMVTAVGQGECNITAWCRGKTATCHVIVVEHLIYIVLDQHDASVLPNHILTLTPTITPASTDLVVTSSNPAVAAARLAGNKIQVVGVTEGTATIYVNSADGYAEADSCLVTVYTEIGDVNCDGFVDITDVTDLIDYLLGSTSGQFSNENADVDHDEKTTINDVTLLIDYLLGSAELQPKDNEGRTFTVNGVSFRMARVDGGTFNMGCTVEQDADADAHEAPVHAVTLSTYLIGQTEVTQELWQAVMGDNPSSFTVDDQCPVERVTWDMCQEFISRLNELTGQNFRLPTEAEWEFAARGGNKSRGYKYAGGNDLAELAWYTDNSAAATHPVGTKKANELGLYDMCGNVNEWCADWYGLYPEEAQTNPSGPESGKSRIYRGGSWQNGAKVCRVTRRNYFAPGAIRNYMGLRLAL